MTPLTTLLHALATARRGGADFDEAWKVATAEALGASCDPGDWAPVLDGTRDSWAAAYPRLPASSHERALSLLAFDAEPVDVGSRCRRCGDTIPPERFKRSPPSFCSDRCRRAFHSARARERVTA